MILAAYHLVVDDDIRTHIFVRAATASSAGGHLVHVGRVYSRGVVGITAPATTAGLRRAELVGVSRYLTGRKSNSFRATLIPQRRKRASVRL